MAYRNDGGWIVSLYRDPVEHAANAPHTWQVVKLADRQWALTDKEGNRLSTFPRYMDADMARHVGWWVDMWEKEDRWYRGEPIPGWKPYVPPVPA